MPIVKCYYCNKKFKPKEKATIAEKWFDDNGGVWIGSAEYPNGLCHMVCDDRYRRQKEKDAT